MATKHLVLDSEANSTPAFVFLRSLDTTRVMVMMSPSTIDNAKIGTNTAHGFELLTNGSPKMTILSGGNVGIGTTTPAVKLHIASGASLIPLRVDGDQAAIHFHNNAGVRKAIVGIRDDISGNTDDKVLLSDAGNWLFVTGNVGINTITPVSGKLQIEQDIVGINALYVKTIGSGTLGLQVDAGSGSGHHVMRLRSAAGAEYMWVGGTGRVGIGTTSPAFEVDISKDKTADNTVMRLINTAVSGLSHSSMVIATTAGSTGDPRINMVVSGSGVPWNIGLDQSDAQKLKISNDSLGDIATNTRLTIDASGQVGIGTVSPTFKLDIVGAGIFSEGTILTGTLPAGTHTGVGATGAGNDLRLFAGGNQNVTVQTGGNVGVGTTSPLTKLHIVTSADVGLLVDDDDNPIFYLRDLNAGSNLKLGGLTSSGGKLQLIHTTDDFNGGNQVAYLTADFATGHVGIGTDSPTGRLHVKVSSTSDDGIYVQHSASSNLVAALYREGTSDRGHLFLSLAGTAMVELSVGGNSYFNGGNVGIGTASPSEFLHISTGVSPAIRLTTTTLQSTGRWSTIRHVTTGGAESELVIQTAAGGGDVTHMRVQADGSVSLCDESVNATGSTQGFFLIRTVSGTPTGVPAIVPTGHVAMEYDTAANKLWVYNGAWRSVTLA